MLEDIKKCCCFTGHREIPQSDLNALRDDLDFEIEKHYILHGVTTFISGGAVGFDMLAAETVIGAKQRHPDIKLVFVLPCDGHNKSWKASDSAKLRVLMLHADQTLCLADHYYRGCMHQRNKFMLEHSAYCISYCRKDSGGTFYTLSLARKTNKTVTEL